MWNKRRSLILSRVSVWVFMILATVLAVSAPWSMRWVIESFSSAKSESYELFVATIYCGYIPAMLLLFYLDRLLSNISKKIVFVPQNVKYLRRISWVCIAGGIVAFVSAFYWYAWFLFAVAAAFFGLIVRVIKNIVAEAVAIKEENDFTI